MSIMHLERAYLIQTLAAVLHECEPPQPPENLDWEKLYKLSVRHSVSNMAHCGITGLSQEQQPPSDIMKAFQIDYKKSIAREAIQHITLEDILQVFEEQQIACVPLKGILVKYLYPRPDMRTMADLDILFQDEQTEQVKKLLTDMGYSVEDEGAYHDVYFKKPIINLQMHRWLMPKSSPYSNYFMNVWDRAILQTGSQFMFRLSPEDFYIHLMVHLTNHYAKAGTGIRSIMDIWLYREHYGNQLDWHYIEAELRKIHLLTFTKNICGLGEVWFANAESNALYDEMADYIFASGVYGNQKNLQLSSMNAVSTQTDANGTVKLKYYLKLFFPGLQHMTILYPFLGALPFLMPICWLLRGVKSLRNRRRNTLAIINIVHSASADDISQIRNHHTRVGLPF